MEADGKESGCVGEGLLSDTQVVFQCESCRSILGDATNWIAATEPLEAFTLNAVTECISIGDTFHHSTQTFDVGSSYTKLFCRICKIELGRRYITTPSHLDYLRDNFTFYVSMVTSYQLGSAGVKTASKPACQELPLLLQLAERCLKLQHLIVTINDRICNIENCLKGEEGNNN